MINRTRPLGLIRSNDALNRGKKFVVPSRCFLTFAVPFREMPQFDAQDSSLNGIEPAIVSLHVVVILLRLAVVPQRSLLSCHLFASGGTGPCFATGAQILAWIETKRSRVT